MTAHREDDTMMTTVLVDDEHLIRSAMAAMLGLNDDIAVLGEAADGSQAIELIGRLAAEDRRPDVVLLDLQMPGLDGIETAERLIGDYAGIGLVIVTSHGRPGYLKRALEVGVRGFVPKTASAEKLAEVVRQVASGGRYVDPELAAEALAAGESPLTPREADVLEFSADGASIEEIAVRASLSPGTTRNYLSSASMKLGAANRHEALAIAKRHGWI